MVAGVKCLALSLIAFVIVLWIFVILIPRIEEAW